MAGTKIQTKDLELKPIVASGTASAYTLSIERLDSYEDGMTIFWTPHVENETGATVNINGLGDIQIMDKSGTVISAGSLQPGIGYFMTYNSSTNGFHVINLGEGAGGGETQEIDMVFDDSNSDLPANTSGTIDGCTVEDGKVVYVKNCSDTNKIGKFYEAQVSGTSIVWNQRYDLKNYNPTYVNCGDVYGGKVNYFSDYLFSGNVTFMGDNVTYSSNTTVNYDGNTINYNQVTENYTDSTTNVDGGNVTYNNTTVNYNSNYTLIGCTSGITSFPADVNLDSNTTKVHLTINYDNSANDISDTWSKELDIVGGVGTVDITESGKTGVLRVTWNTGDTAIHLDKVSGDGNFTVDACQYSGGVIINDNGSIQNVSNITQNYQSVNQYYDENSTIVNQGDTILNNVYVNNIYNQDGSPITGEGGYKLDVVEMNDSGTTITLNKIPVSNIYIKVYKKDSGLVWFETQDYTYDSNNNQIILNQPLTTGEAVRVEYWYKGTEVTNPQDNYNTVNVVNDTYNANAGEFILVTYNSGDVTINLPDANVNEGKIVSVKKRTGENINNVIVVAQSGQTVDGISSFQWNTDGESHDFIAFGGNWYIK